MNDKTMFEATADLYFNKDVGMYYCGKRVKSINHVYGPEIRNHYLFVLVNEGEAEFYHKNGTVSLKAHDLLVMCPGEKIYYKANTLWSIQWVGLYGQIVEKHMKQLGIDGDHPIVKIQRYYEMEKVLQELYDTANERFEYSKCNQISLIFKFFSLLLENSSQKSVLDVAESLKKILDYNFNNDISIKTVAKTLYVTTEYLTRKFTQKFCVSPKAYLINKRIELAKKLLAESEASVKEISNSVGYEDQLYFSRVFKNQEGVSPTEYRKSEKKEEPMNKALF